MRPSRLAVAAALVVALSACRTAPVRPPAEVQPPAAQAPAVQRREGPARVALVLGGGAARGFAHVGVLRVLEDEKIPIDLVVGTSVGSLVGALYADGRDARQLEALARDLDRDDFFDFGLGSAIFGTGLASGNRLERWMTEHLRARNIEQLDRPYAAVATDLDDGGVVVLRKGDVARAVRASSAIPGVFEPVRADGKLLVDGGVVANLPVKVARQLGGDVVIAVDVTEVTGKAEPESFVEVVMRAVTILTHEGVAESAREADVLVSPAVGDVGLLDFDAKDRAIAAGVAAARAKLPEIRKAVARAAAGRAE